MSIIIELLLEVALQIVLQVVGELGWEFAKAAREGAREARKHPPAAAGCILPLIALVLAGAAVGGLSLLIRPHRLFQPGALVGWSIFIAPLCVGGAMHFFGKYRESRGHQPTTLATFAGGACFAFGTALIRGLGVR